MAILGAPLQFPVRIPMAVRNFSALTNGQAISFDPNADVLNFDQTTISAANLNVAADGSNVRVAVLSGTDAGKSILLQNASLPQLASANVSFANGSGLIFGDNSTGTANDDAANSLSGTGGNDLIKGLGGNDTVYGNSGNDWIEGGAGNDSLSGGGDQDSYAFRE